jgi:hypothetical protein
VIRSKFVAARSSAFTADLNQNLLLARLMVIFKSINTKGINFLLSSAHIARRSSSNAVQGAVMPAEEMHRLPLHAQ